MFFHVLSGVMELILVRLKEGDLLVIDLFTSDSPRNQTMWSDRNGRNYPASDTFKLENLY